MEGPTLGGVFAFLLGIIILFGAVLTAGMAGCPRYSVWQQEMKGKAELIRARENRKIKIEEAEAVKESSVFLAEAEIIQAHGVAEANEIIGESLKDNQAYPN